MLYHAVANEIKDLASFHCFICWILTAATWKGWPMCYLQMVTVLHIIPVHNGNCLESLWFVDSSPESLHPRPEALRPSSSKVLSLVKCILQVPFTSLTLNVALCLACLQNNSKCSLLHLILCFECQLIQPACLCYAWMYILALDGASITIFQVLEECCRRWGTLSKASCRGAGGEHASKAWRHFHLANAEHGTQCRGKLGFFFEPLKKAKHAEAGSVLWATMPPSGPQLTPLMTGGYLKMWNWESYLAFR